MISEPIAAVSISRYRPHSTPPETGQRRAGDEDADEEPPDAIAERLDHLAVLDAGADQQADLGAIQHEEHGDEDDQPDGHGEQAVFLDGHVAEQEDAAKRRRQRQRDLVGAPDDVDHLLGDDHAAHGDEDLLEMLAVHRHDDDALEGPAERAGDEHGQRDSQSQRGEIHQRRVGLHPALHRQQHQGRGEGTDGNKGAVTEVEHVHQAEDQCQAARHDEDHHAHGEPGDGERHPGGETADQRQGQNGQDRQHQQGRHIESQPGQFALGGRGGDSRRH